MCKRELSYQNIFLRSCNQHFYRINVSNNNIIIIIMMIMWENNAKGVAHSDEHDIYQLNLRLMENYLIL